ncbi:MAG: F0F1 ATP synthase subunit A [Oscillospiraceae bacterium]|jgi:F-type H+-transporting ATPase subunit a
MNMTGPKILFTIPIFGGLNVTQTVVTGWGIIIAITLLCLWLTKDLKVRPSKKQVVAEMIVTSINKLVKQAMGERNIGFAPYICALFMFSSIGSLVSLLSLRSMTADINVTICWGLMTFAVVTFYKFKNNGFFGYFKSFSQPVVFMTPLNIVSEVAMPVSLGFRHFGNIAGGMVITMLIYTALSAITNAIGIAVPFFMVGIPAVLSIYFDLFTGFMQAFIFCMLSMAYISSAQE